MPWGVEVIRRLWVRFTDWLDFVEPAPVDEADVMFAPHGELGHVEEIRRGWTV